jgi:ribonuclease Y
VEKSFAVQAGRELRVLVQPEQVNDEEAFELARKIASRIQNELQYPGQIKVTVIRETRCVEVAK